MSTIELVYAEVVVSFATALGLLVICSIQLAYRTTRRHRDLLKVQREIRFDGAYLLSQPEQDRRRLIVEEGMKVHAFRITDPPQYNRVIPAEVADSRDSRQDCAEMLNRTRSVLTRTHGKSAELMSMRCCLSCIKGVLPAEQSERFLRIYEAVVFGSHRVDGSEKLLSTDDIKFLHAFFYNVILKELQ